MGSGRIAQSVHLFVSTHLPGVQLVALAEANPERLKKSRSLHSEGCWAGHSIGEDRDLVNVRSVFSTATQYSVIGEQSPQTRSLLLDLAFHHVDLIHYF
jgi:predicted dehydrogenase